MVLLRTVHWKVLWGTKTGSSMALLWKPPFGSFIFKSAVWTWKASRSLSLSFLCLSDLIGWELHMLYLRSAPHHRRDCVKGLSEMDEDRSQARVLLLTPLSQVLGQRSGLAWPQSSLAVCEDVCQSLHTNHSSLVLSHLWITCWKEVHFRIV